MAHPGASTHYVEYNPTKLSQNITQFLTSYGVKRDFSPGHVLATEGQMSRSVFVILNGQAEILKMDEMGDESVIASVGQGTIIGEMGAFLDQKRTGTIRAASDLTVLEFSNESFMTALNKLPELSQRMFKSLSTKITTANQTILGLTNARTILIVGVALFEKRSGPDAGMEQVSIHPTQMAESTKLGRKTLRAVLEHFKSKHIITASNTTYDGTMMLSIDFNKLGYYLKQGINNPDLDLSNIPADTDVAEKTADATPAAKKGGGLPSK